MTLRLGTQVSWSWGNGEAVGKIVERFDRDVTRTLKGSEVTRKASSDKPAFLIEQSDGDLVLKSCTELERANS